jgi:hypothetical protein
VFGSLRSYRRSILSSAPPFASIGSYAPARPVVTATSWRPHSIVAVYAGDAVNLTSTSTALVHIVVENTSMTLAASSNRAPAGTFIIFTATVVPGSSGTPTGTVTFQDGSATLGTSTLSASGVADILSVTFTPTDAAGFKTATASVTLAVDDFTLGGNGVSSQTVTAGGAASFELTVSSTGSTTLLDPVGLSISGLPQGATFTFSPVTVPAGSLSTAVSLVIQVGDSSAKLTAEPDDYSPHEGTPILLLVLLPPLLGMKSLRKRIQSAPRSLTVLLFVFLGMSAAAALNGCAGRPPGFPSHGGKTYNLVVTATSGTLHHSLPLKLVVQK